MGTAFLYGNGGSGGGLSLRVLGGTTQPTNPREGTIWVNTSAEKPDYIISRSQPGSPASGLVWIKLGSDGVSLPVDKKGTLAITLAGCAVWNGSDWGNVDAWVYTGGKWVQFSYAFYYLIKDGDIYAPPAGWSGRKTYHNDGQYETNSAPQITKVDGGLRFTLSGKQYVRSMYATNAAIDITKYSTLIAKRLANDGYGFIGVAKNYNVEVNGTGATAAAIEKCDISQLSGMYYVILTIGNDKYSVDMTLADIWLE